MHDLQARCPAWGSDPSLPGKNISTGDYPTVCALPTQGTALDYTMSLPSLPILMWLPFYSTYMCLCVCVHVYKYIILDILNSIYIFLYIKLYYFHHKLLLNPQYHTVLQEDH